MEFIIGLQGLEIKSLIIRKRKTQISKTITMCTLLGMITERRV